MTCSIAYGSSFSSASHLGSDQSERLVHSLMMRSSIQSRRKANHAPNLTAFGAGFSSAGFESFALMLTRFGGGLLRIDGGGGLFISGGGPCPGRRAIGTRVAFRCCCVMFVICMIKSRFRFTMHWPRDKKQARKTWESVQSACSFLLLASSVFNSSRKSISSWLPPNHPFFSFFVFLRMRNRSNREESIHLVLVSLEFARQFRVILIFLLNRSDHVLVVSSLLLQLLRNQFHLSVRTGTKRHSWAYLIRNFLHLVIQRLQLLRRLLLILLLSQVAAVARVALPAWHFVALSDFRGRRIRSRQWLRHVNARVRTLQQSARLLGLFRLFGSIFSATQALFLNVSTNWEIAKKTERTLWLFFSFFLWVSSPIFS